MALLFPSDTIKLIFSLCVGEAFCSEIHVLLVKMFLRNLGWETVDANFRKVFKLLAINKGSSFPEPFTFRRFGGSLFDLDGKTEHSGARRNTPELG